MKKKTASSTHNKDLCSFCKRKLTTPIKARGNPAYCKHCSAERRKIAASAFNRRPITQADIDFGYMVNQPYHAIHAAKKKSSSSA
jgi:hypothetical protein